MVLQLSCPAAASVYSWRLDARYAFSSVPSFRHRHKQMLVEYVQIKSKGGGKPYRSLLAVVPAHSLPLPSRGGVSKRKEEANSASIPTPAAVP